MLNVRDPFLDKCFSRIDQKSRISEKIFLISSFFDGK